MVAHEPITLGFVGDIGLGSYIAEAVGERGAGYVLDPTRAILNDCDLVAGNLECVLHEGSPQDSAVPGLCALPEQLDYLADSPVRILNIANNHVMDLGEAGLEKLLGHIRARDFDFFGAGRDLEEAETTLYRRVGDARVAFIGACDVTALYATHKSGGVAPMTRRTLLRRVAEAKANADIVIVSLHADIEFSFYPSPFRRGLARALIDAGASLVAQHHPHVCQGIERYHGGVIAYSLGNFIFGIHGNAYQETRAGTREGMILKLRFSGNPSEEPEYSVVPVHIGDDHRPQPLDKVRRQIWETALAEISRNTTDSALLRREWRRICRAEAKRVLLESYYTWRKRGLRVAASRLYQLLKSREHWHWILGLVSFGFI